MLVKYAYQRDVVEPVYVDTASEVADILTKATDQKTFDKMRRYVYNLAPKPFREKAERLLMKMNSIVNSFEY